jgi:aminoglycoside phosphotransferase (APT) family kinase protein
VLTPPDELSEADLAVTLARHWRMTVNSMTYIPVGWGSHHWEVTDAAGTRWFISADDLRKKQESLTESLDVAFARLRAALCVATDLRDLGNAFVVAPVATVDGKPVARASDEFGVAVYQLVEGQSFDWEEFASPEHKQAMLDMVVAVHMAPPAARRRACSDQFVIPHRDELEAVLTGAAAGLADAGPYSRPTIELITRNAVPILRELGRYDELAIRARAEVPRAVLTHGEPHPKNSMLADDGWRLIDWDTALVAPPERDLWSLDPGDGSVLAAYAEATGVRPLAPLIELYRIRWNLADVAVDVSRFQARHPGSPEDDKSWGFLSSLVAEICS